MRYKKFKVGDIVACNASNYKEVIMFEISEVCLETFLVLPGSAMKFYLDELDPTNITMLDFAWERQDSCWIPYATMRNLYDKALTV